jgi:NDP-sugar pyrophosphorylase family protein
MAHLELNSTKDGCRGIELAAGKTRENGTSVKFDDLQTRIQPPEGMVRSAWKQHPNGGGWVARSASVDDSVFIGPDAIVMESAHVTGKSRIEKKAIISGGAVVIDSVVTDDAEVSGMAKVLKSHVGGSAEVRGTAILDSKRRTNGRVNQPDRGR